MVLSGVHAWVQWGRISFEAPFMGLLLTLSAKRLAKAVGPKRPEGVCRGNRISPCRLRDLRVSVLKLL